MRGSSFGVLQIKQQMQEDWESARAHAEPNVSDAIQKREALLTSFGVDVGCEVLICCMPRIKPSRIVGVNQTSGMVPDVPHVQHVVQVRQASSHGRSVTALRINSELPQGASIVHEDDDWQAPPLT